MDKCYLKWAKTTSVHEALKRRELFVANAMGRSLFPLFEARKANFNSLVRDVNLEKKGLKLLDLLIEAYCSTVLQYVHGTGSSRFDILQSESSGIEFNCQDEEEPKETFEVPLTSKQRKSPSTKGKPSKSSDQEQTPYVEGERSSSQRATEFEQSKSSSSSEERLSSPPITRHLSHVRIVGSLHEYLLKFLFNLGTFQVFSISWMDDEDVEAVAAKKKRALIAANLDNVKKGEGSNRGGSSSARGTRSKRKPTQGGRGSCQSDRGGHSRGGDRGGGRDEEKLESFIRNHQTMASMRYTYSEIKRITNSFKERLGEGGYGTVYKGKLLNNNRLVAVKILNKTKGSGEDFVNEVSSISRTSHVNIVNLLGFSLKSGKRALVYEFMPNGSLDKFIHKDFVRMGKWEKLRQIATGIARGLEYLHLGCNTRILHFDIKPQNILLDENHCPKISDFGLAKMCAENESIVSMFGARGTIGYIAPEIVSRIIGPVSYKSDVYSYGMLVLEMVGVLKNTNNRNENMMEASSEMYFPDWVHKHLEEDNIEDLLQGDMKNEEIDIARKMISVGLWCVQMDPSKRPHMSKVVEMLEGTLDAMHNPPNPNALSSSVIANYSSLSSAVDDFV
ncbi:probable receptor-like protein kinase At5g39030 [Impatiens glandulifera]|uniref:probable receptor-like protein kinase At5g39030 n=1 Tax=Impatiens glandulifera TaxID=253017 RepID=UPI001FB0831C|nr:probable receptor-like protein kinase At5g39030 [Impatiens glandulifera]